MAKKQNRYAALIESIFLAHYRKGAVHFEFEREELLQAAKKLKVVLPKNVGDVIYSFRYRTDFPPKIKATEPSGQEWIIEGVGDARYRFRLAKMCRIVPSPDAFQIKLPDATPGIIKMYAKSDEQALLAKVRYNRLVDIFLRVTAHSVQNHLRTKVPNVGQIEIDELYVAVRNTGQQFVIPVQAKGGSDQIGVTQVTQDLLYCRHVYPSLIPRSIAVQFIEEDAIAMFELTLHGEEVKKVDEKQYRLVAPSDISGDDLEVMSRHSE